MEEGEIVLVKGAEELGPFDFLQPLVLVAEVDAQDAASLTVSGAVSNPRGPPLARFDPPPDLIVIGGCRGGAHGFLHWLRVNKAGR